MRNKTLIISIFVMMILLSPGLINSQEETEKFSLDSETKETIQGLVEEYRELVRNNARWHEKDSVVKNIKRYIDRNYHYAEAYEVIVEWYYTNYPISNARKYGQKALDISAKLNQMFFTRDLVYKMGLFYLKKQYLDYGKALGYFKIVNNLGKDDYSSKADLFYHMGLCYRKLQIVKGNGEDLRYLYMAEVSYEFSVFLEKSIENYFELGKTYELLKKYDYALESYNKALDINPSYQKALQTKENLVKLMENLSPKNNNNNQ
jgi:tetratricopeptide (TPR) repeat protein